MVPRAVRDNASPALFRGQTADRMRGSSELESPSAAELWSQARASAAVEKDRHLLPATGSRFLQVLTLEMQRLALSQQAVYGRAGLHLARHIRQMHHDRRFQPHKRMPTGVR